MISPPAVPIPPDLGRRYSGNSEGRAWLSALPGRIGQCLERWGLEPDLAPGGRPWNGHGAVVVPVRRSADGKAAVLKLAFPHDESLAERHALALWGGRGAVELLDAEPASGALLLERLDGGRSLQDVPLDEAVNIWGSLVRQLALQPDDRPQWREFGHVAAQAEQWSDELPESWERLGRPFPRWLLEAALEVCQTRGAVGRRSARDVLVHADLHFLNVLATPTCGASGASADVGTAGFKAIDPHPLVGEAEFAVAPLLWNRLAELPRTGAPRALLERCAALAAAAGLDGEVARQWAVVREVENALWYAAKRHHDGDVARSLWVASTLAGDTLPGLPAGPDLPAPGGAVQVMSAPR
ncbi:aminoglycoside phosphotransferase family protein [Arthrobacter sp. Soil763]|uniref:aminoglycoside phosphotransferase family protein n=1 Tax=Arthrobacter sp. Soil763 TaxID=1736402 RepID=UPI0006FE1D06|nr:aminoglycoside phosphotransferase family protein [Arthrobacter sp. Soil763]KRE77513.1 aminoglycoside resistance protein [Arthrobacter sp. Soil763]